MHTRRSCVRSARRHALEGGSGSLCVLALACCVARPAAHTHATQRSEKNTAQHMCVCRGSQQHTAGHFLGRAIIMGRTGSLKSALSSTVRALLGAKALRPCARRHALEGGSGLAFCACSRLLCSTARPAHTHTQYSGRRRTQHNTSVCVCQPTTHREEQPTRKARRSRGARSSCWRAAWRPPEREL